jgi:hypothetical protein
MFRTEVFFDYMIEEINECKREILLENILNEIKSN